MGRKRYPETRNVVAAVKARMARKGADTTQIVQEIIKKHLDVLDRERLDHYATSLTKLVGGTSGEKVSVPAGQLEMFDDYKLGPLIHLHLADGSREHRLLNTVSHREIATHIEIVTAPKQNPPKRSDHENYKLVRLLDDLEPYKQSDDSTIGESWDALRAARGG